MTQQSAERHSAMGAHVSILMACTIWGLMAPIGKDAMLHGIDGITLISFRVLGGAILFWLGSWFMQLIGGHDAKPEKLTTREKFTFAACAVFGILLNQCGFTIGLDNTSPTNASIITTSMPIFAMVLSFIILKEPITCKKAGGVALGCAGAITLILTSAQASNAKVGNIRGDLMVLGAQFSYALFLSLFNKFIRRFSVFTVNKWMFTWASLILWSITIWHIKDVDWQAISARTWLEAGYVVVFGTFIAYIFMIVAQKRLRPTVVSVYNNIQPIVAVAVSLAMGIAVFSWRQVLAIVLIFAGVTLVNRSKARQEPH